MHGPRARRLHYGVLGRRGEGQARQQERDAQGGVQPDVRPTDRYHSEALRKEHTQDGEDDVGDPGEDREDASVGVRAGRGDPPQSEDEVDQVVEEVDRE